MSPRQKITAFVVALAAIVLVIGFTATSSAGDSTPPTTVKIVAKTTVKTTTTTAPPTTTTTHLSRRLGQLTTTIAPQGQVTTPAPTSGISVESTAYCLTGGMANGVKAHVGAVAANRWPLGTRLWVSGSPTGPGVFTVEDTIGSGSQLDFAMPGNCAGAIQWGRRSVVVTVQ